MLEREADVLEPIPHVGPDCHIIPVREQRMGVDLVVAVRLRILAARTSRRMACSNRWRCAGMNRTVQAVDRRRQPSVGW